MNDGGQIAGKVEQLFAVDRVAADLGVELLMVDDATVRLALVVDERHTGWHGRCHGGVLFTVADIAMSYVGNRFAETAYATHAAVDFLAGVERGDRLVIDAVETARQGRTAVCDVTLTVADRVVAVFRGSTLQVRG